MSLPCVLLITHAIAIFSTDRQRGSLDEQHGVSGVNYYYPQRQTEKMPAPAGLWGAISALLQDAVCLSRSAEECRLQFKTWVMEGQRENTGQSVTPKAFALPRQMALGTGCCHTAHA